MNTIELQSIVFILAAYTMFLTTPSDRHPIKSAIAGHGYDVWNRVTLTVDFPWYYVSYSKCPEAKLGINGTEFLCKPDQVAEFLSQNVGLIQTDQLLLVSPPRLNRTKQWLLEPLAEVWRGNLEDSAFYVHVYLLQDGRHYVDAPNAREWRALKNLTQLVQYSPPGAN
ncbi:MAG: hypothetical protein HYU74_07025 [Dechloromonas sp.]|nr:hypothetical protein [Dechloromonas sp.]